MGAFGGYAPQDFLLFSAETYWRLFELTNRALWPAPLLALGLGLVVVAAAARPSAPTDRAAAALLALGWLGTAQGFVAARYGAINWAAAELVPAFLAEAVLLLILGAGLGRLRLDPGRGLRGRVGLALLLIAVLAYPALAPAFGRPPMGAEVVGLAPDPTALATLGVLALMPRGALAALLALVPVLWCAGSVAVLLTMGAAEGWVLLALLLAGVGAQALPCPPDARQELH